MDMNSATSGRVHPCISNAPRIDAGGFRDMDTNTGRLALSVLIAGNNSRWHQPPTMSGCTYFCSMEATARIWTSDTNPGWLDHQTLVSSTDQSIQNDIRIEVCRLQVHHNILMELTGTRPWMLFPSMQSKTCSIVTALKSYPYDVRITKYIGTKIEMVPYNLHNWYSSRSAESRSSTPVTGALVKQRNAKDCLKKFLECHSLIHWFLCPGYCPLDSEVCSQITHVLG